MTAIETSLTAREKEFLLQLYQQTSGDLNGKADTAAIGTSIGMDKTDARKISEELIGHGFAVVKTLSGGIGITSEGLAEAQKLGAGAGNTTPILGQAPVIDAEGCRMLEKVLGELKQAVARNRLDYETMAEVVIDMKTIETQLLSPKPKTVIIKSSLMSMAEALKRARADQGLSLIHSLIGTAE